MKLSEQILQYVLKELESRDVLDKDAYENMFGCKSFDEVADGIENYLNKGIG